MRIFFRKHGWIFSIACGLIGCAELQMQGSNSSPPQPVQIKTESDDRPITRVAIVVATAHEFPADKAEGLLAEAFVKKGYTVASTADARQVLQDALTRDSAYFDRQENTQRLGRLLKVDAIFHLKPTEIKVVQDQRGQRSLARISASAKLIDSERASLRWVKNVDAGNDFLIVLGVGDGKIVDKLVSNIMSTFPPAQK